MVFKKILNIIDGIENDTKKPSVITEGKIVQERTNTPSIIEKYMNEILEEHRVEHDKKISEAHDLAERVSNHWFAKHHLGHGERFEKDIKKSHGLRGSVRKSARYGAAKRVHHGHHHLRGIYETTDGIDYVSMDIPLLIRLLEYAREDAQTDMDLHNVADNLIQLSQDNDVLNMDHYDSIVGTNENT